MIEARFCHDPIGNHDILPLHPSKRQSHIVVQQNNCYNRARFESMSEHGAWTQLPKEINTTNA